MNHDRLHNFQKLVISIVDPLRASGGRKRRMTDELLAHLWQAYEQEREQTKDEDAAAQAAIRRLGDPSQLSVSLQACVPFPEIILSLGRKETPMSRWFWLLLGIAAAFVGAGLVLPALAKYKASGSLPPDAATFLAIGVLIVLAGVFLVGFAVSRLIFRRA